MQAHPFFDHGEDEADDDQVPALQMLVRYVLEDCEPTMENTIIQSSHHNFCFLSHRARSRRQTMTKASTVTEAVVAVTHGCSESSWSAILSDHDMRDCSSG
jgi:hypothetical protein